MNEFNDPGDTMLSGFPKQSHLEMKVNSQNHKIKVCLLLTLATLDIILMKPVHMFSSLSLSGPRRSAGIIGVTSEETHQ